jgi:hypothetical protein
LTSTLLRVFDSLSVGEASWLALTATLAFFALLAAEAFVGGAVLRRLAWLGAFAALVALLPWIFALQRERTDAMLVIAQNGTSLHSEPRAEATAIESLPGGARVRRLDSIPGWIKIGGEKNDAGWAREETLFALAR